MLVKYIGESFLLGLTNGKEYKCLGVEGPFLRIIDDSEDDYLYSAISPGSMNAPYETGRWQIIEDTMSGSLRHAIGEQSGLAIS